MRENRIQEMAKQFTEYDMIQAHTELPQYPSGRTGLLYTYLSQSDKQQHARNELFALAVSLVQIGLDTHDLIDRPRRRSQDGQARSKQLKVLAGDYFSGRFYHLLSQAGHIEAIEMLSHAICEVNRMKLNLYTAMQRHEMTSECYLEQTVHIRTKLFLSFTDYMAGQYAESWPAVLHIFTKCELLHEEMNRMETPDQFQESWGYWFLLNSATKEERRYFVGSMIDQARLNSLVMKYNLHTQLSHMIETHSKHMLEKVERLDCEFTMEHLSRIEWEPLQYSAAKVLEEI